MDSTEPTKPACPACGSLMWPDPAQVHEVLELRAVYANTNDRESRLTDDRDERQPKFYTRQTLVKSSDEHRGAA